MLDLRESLRRIARYASGTTATWTRACSSRRPWTGSAEERRRWTRRIGRSRWQTRVRARNGGRAATCARYGGPRRSGQSTVAARDCASRCLAAASRARALIDLGGAFRRYGEPRGLPRAVAHRPRYRRRRRGRASGSARPRGAKRQWRLRLETVSRRRAHPSERRTVDMAAAGMAPRLEALGVGCLVVSRCPLGPRACRGDDVYQADAWRRGRRPEQD